MQRIGIPLYAPMVQSGNEFMKNLKAVIGTIACAVMIAGSALTVNAEEGTEIANTPVNANDKSREYEGIRGVTPEIMNTVTQTTPGGINIYGYQPGYGVNPITGEFLCHQWAPEYLTAIDAMGVTNEMSQYDKCVTIANYLCEVLEYGGGQFGQIALAEGGAACGGYANAFQEICLALGIKCEYIGSDEMNHAWNEVYIDGVTYYVDVTWMDTVHDNKYLMSTTLWPDHTGGKAEHPIDANIFDDQFGKISATNELDGSEVTITYTPANR